MGNMLFCPQRLIASHLADDSAGLPAEYRGDLQFDYIHKYSRGFNSPSDMVALEETAERTALWLTSYLAHWGMFRGSSKLPKSNFLLLKDWTRSLLDRDSGALRPLFNVSFEKIACQEKEVVSRVLKDSGQFLEQRGVSATNTLISKAILALLGNVPAYDRYFCKGIKALKENGQYNGVLKFDAQGLMDLSKWSASCQWPTVTSQIDKGLKLPRGRLVDMALHWYGLEKETKKS